MIENKVFRAITEAVIYTAKGPTRIQKSEGRIQDKVIAFGSALKNKLS